MQPQHLPLDDVDRALVRALSRNARASGAALAAEVGIAESTVSTRIRRLQAAGDIRGYRVDLDFDRVAPLQALISVRLAKHARGEVDRFRDAAPTWPGVRSLFHMAGADDYLLHVAANSATDLRDFVLTHLASHPAVKRTQTNLIFEHAEGTGWLELL
ncbi:MAG: transcriptional regulator [Glaciihabitans sp.]|jgi:DNA-binding Lrp family transcriptional regulator|nr:transcriptional regulator [Glaciihabitans sp.]